jgi:hypothetical protein
VNTTLVIAAVALATLVLGFWLGWYVYWRRAGSRMEGALAAAQARGRETEQWADDLTGQRDQARAAAEQLAADLRAMGEEHAYEENHRRDAEAEILRQVAMLRDRDRQIEVGHAALKHAVAERDATRAELNAVVLDEDTNPVLCGLVTDPRFRVPVMDATAQAGLDALHGWTGQWAAIKVPVLPAELERVARNVTPPKGVPTPKRPPRQAKRALQGQAAA